MILIEFFTTLFVISLVILLSLFIMPTIFFGIGFIAIFFLLLGMIVFFSFSLLWLAPIFLGIMLLIATNKLIRYWRLPSYAEYTKNHDSSQKEISCTRCGSKQVIHLGLFGPQSSWRYYMCVSCHKYLYKFKVL